uniref:EF-hand domain-containing protein n=1 Tax=Alexandrium catenella TaxID=2925 RepID=A0A7S1WXH9_ALECA
MRILRVARVIRVMRFFRELRMMIYSILGSMKALLWSVAVLTLMFFIFGISLTLGTIYHLDTIDLWESAETEDLRRSFGSLPRSILSLYMAMSGGRNWGDFFRILLDVSGSYSLLFLLFVTVAIFAVGNVVTGIFVENALESNQTDKETLVQDEMEARKDYFSHMQEVFNELDDDTDGVITMDEFERKLDDERVIAYFNVLNLDVSDARMLFTLLDYDQSGEVAVEEFLAGCNKLKGESRSLDLAIMQLEVRWLKEAFLGFADFMADSMNKNKTDGRTSPTRRLRCVKTMT